MAGFEKEINFLFRKMESRKVRRVKSRKVRRVKVAGGKRKSFSAICFFFIIKNGQIY